jgi:hypothetical protein
VFWNEIANLAQNVELASCWLNCFVFHACRVAGSKRQANTFSNFLWDRCDFLSMFSLSVRLENSFLGVDSAYLDL